MIGLFFNLLNLATALELHGLAMERRQGLLTQRPHIPRGNAGQVGSVRGCIEPTLSRYDENMTIMQRLRHAIHAAKRRNTSWSGKYRVLKAWGIACAGTFYLIRDGLIAASHDRKNRVRVVGSCATPVVKTKRVEGRRDELEYEPPFFRRRVFDGMLRQQCARETQILHFNRKGCSGAMSTERFCRDGSDGN